MDAPGRTTGQLGPARLSLGRAAAWTACLACAFVLAGTPSALAQETTLTGTVVARQSDDFDAQQSRSTLLLNRDQGSDVRLVGETDDLTPGMRAEVSGELRSETLEVEDAEKLRQPRQAVAAASQNKKVAVLLLNFSDNRSQPWTKSQIKNTMFDAPNSVANYFAEQSSGDVAIEGDVFGWYEIASNDNSCNYSTYAAQALAAANAAGDPISGYDNYVFMWPDASACGWAGLAYMPGTLSFINGAPTLRVISHELSHNFGVHHASTRRCTTNGQRTFISSTCSDSEYGDPFTVMGAASTYHSHALHKMQMNQLHQSVATIGGSGEYTVASSEQQTNDIQLLRVPRSSNEYYYLEYRRPFGNYFDNFSITDPVVNGVSIRLAPALNVRQQSKLLDANPQTTTFNDAPLGVGQTVTDPAAKLSFRTISTSAAGARVAINFNADGSQPEQGQAPPSTPPKSPSDDEQDGASPDPDDEDSGDIKLAVAARGKGVIQSKRLLVAAACEPGCSLTATGSLSVKKSRGALMSAGAASQAGTTTKLALKLPPRTLRLAKIALRNNRRATFDLNVIADAGGESKTVKRRFRLEK